MVDRRAVVQPLEPCRRLGASAGTGATTWRCQTGDDLPPRHQHPSSPEGRRRGQKGGSSAQRDERQALGRSRGGFGSKACVIADASGRAIGFALAPGQAHQLTIVPLLLSFLLPVTLKGPASSIPDRVAGWGLASAAAPGVSRRLLDAHVQAHRRNVATLPEKGRL